jgi:hypothetical protein
MKLNNIKRFTLFALVAIISWLVCSTVLIRTLESSDLFANYFVYLVNNYQGWVGVPISANIDNLKDFVSNFADIVGFISGVFIGGIVLWKTRTINGINGVIGIKGGINGA